MRRTRRGSFVLLEVLVTLVILSVGLTTLLQNFVRALTHLERERITTTAVFLADYLVEEFQNESPVQDSDEGEFGDSYPGYRWTMGVESEEGEYDIDSDRLAEEQRYREWLRIQIWYDHPQRTEPMLAIEVRTCLMGFERFSTEAIQAGGLFMTE